MIQPSLWSLLCAMVSHFEITPRFESTNHYRSMLFAGMNLVAKEFVACQINSNPGVLIVSPFAGAGEMMHEALICNPYEIDDAAEVIHRYVQVFFHLFESISSQLVSFVPISQSVNNARRRTSPQNELFTKTRERKRRQLLDAFVPQSHGYVDHRRWRRCPQDHNATCHFGRF